MWPKLDRVEICACLSGTAGQEPLGADGQAVFGGNAPNWHDGRWRGPLQVDRHPQFSLKVHQKVSTTSVHSDCFETVPKRAFRGRDEKSMVKVFVRVC